MEFQEGHGLIAQTSSHSPDEVIASFSAILKDKGILLFAVIDHSGEAAKVGIEMRPTKLLIFGDPKMGTPLMLAAPTSAIDLPLKILVWQDEAGITQIAYNDPAYLGARHGIPEELLKAVSGVASLVAKVAG